MSKFYTIDSAAYSKALSEKSAQWAIFQRDEELVAVRKSELDRLRLLEKAVRDLRDLLGYNCDINDFDRPLSSVLLTAEVLAHIFEEV